MTWRERLEPARRAAPAVLLRVGLVLVVLELVYLLLANVVLMTPLLRSAVNPTEDVELEYDWAYSPWPGRVHVKNLRLSVQDYNVQFLVGVERASLDLRLDQLAARRIHIVRVDAEGTTYRMRHKLQAVGKNARRVAAYPPIAAFSDPPLYRGPPPPPIPDSEYALWDVRIENVTTTVREVWVLEYRYRGRGHAYGTFHVKPARWYEVAQSGLELSGGKLTVADVPVAERATLKAECRIEGTDPRAASGLVPLRTIFAKLHGEFEGTNLAFLNVYFEPFLGASATGSAELKFGLNLDRGVVQKGSKVAFTTRALAIDSGGLRFEGAPKVGLVAAGDAGPPQLVVSASAERLAAKGAEGQVPGPFVERPEGGLTLPADLSRPLRVLAARAKVPKAVVPDLAWFEPLVTGAKTRLRGEGTAELEVERAQSGDFRGAVAASVRGARFERGALAVSGHFALDSRFDAPEGGGRGLAFQRVRFKAEGARFGAAASQSPPWTATIASDDTKLTSFEPVRARGSLSVRASRTEPLLPLVVESGVLRDLMVAGLGLKDLSARTHFEVEPEELRIEVRDARSGAVTARGYLRRKSESEPDGRFLLSTSLANVGVRIDAGETSVKPLVSDDWLPKNAFVLPRAKSERKN